jgi:hypothetical protein
VRRLGVSILVLVGLLVLWSGTRTTSVVVAQGNGKVKVWLVDDCDPTDPGWASTGGCGLKQGDVNTAEFGAFLTSPLAPGSLGKTPPPVFPQLIGHPAWAIEPNYTKTSKTTIRVENEGGRAHTFTEVANFGGGFVPQLNFGMTMATECGSPGAVLNHGDRLDITGFSVGNHKFQCCIHPWMRAVVKVQD